MHIGLDDLERVFRERVIRRLGTFYAPPLEKEFLDSLPRRVWGFQMPKDWKVGKIDWSGHEEAEALQKAYENRAGWGGASQVTGSLFIPFGIVALAVEFLPVWVGAFLCSLGGAFLGVPLLHRLMSRSRLRKRITWRELTLAIAEVRMNEAEHKYIHVLDEAIRIEADPNVERDVRRILRSCAEVLERYRELEALQGDLPSGPNEHLIQRNEWEISAIDSQLADESDVIVNDSLRSQRETLVATNESLRQVGMLARRAEAQMRSIETILDGARAGVARMRLGRGPMRDEEASNLLDRLQRLSVESSSLERALLEVHEMEQVVQVREEGS